MRKNTEKLMETLRAECLRHTKRENTIYGVNEQVSLLWYVDDDDDRFIMVRDSVSCDDFVLLRRDHRQVFSVVLFDIPTTVMYIKKGLESLVNGTKSVELAP